MILTILDMRLHEFSGQRRRFNHCKSDNEQKQQQAIGIAGTCERSDGWMIWVESLSPTSMNWTWHKMTTANRKNDPQMWHCLLLWTQNIYVIPCLCLFARKGATPADKHFLYFQELTLWLIWIGLWFADRPACLHPYILCTENKLYWLLVGSDARSQVPRASLLKGQYGGASWSHQECPFTKW